MSEVFVSILVNSNSSDKIIKLFDNIEKTVINITSIEFVVHTAKSDNQTTAAVHSECARRKFKIKCLSTDLIVDYESYWKALNLLLKEVDDKAYFIINLSDEANFVTYGWDQELQKYRNYYLDDIFRLRLSNYKYRNYFDFWESAFAPESICFNTKKWIELCGDWSPCAGHHSFQQSIAFYLFTSEKFSSDQINRDIAINNIEINVERTKYFDKDRIKKYRQRLQHSKFWFNLMSHKVQEESKRRAMRIKAEILIKKDFKISSYTENIAKKKFIVLDGNNKKIVELSYRLNKIIISIINIYKIHSLLYYSKGVRFKKTYTTPIIIFITSHFIKGDYILGSLLKINNFFKVNVRFLINKLSSVLSIKRENKNKFFLCKSPNILNSKTKKIFLIDSNIKDMYKDERGPYISIHLSTNRITNLIDLIDNIKNTVNNIHHIELIIHVDRSDYKIISYLDDFKNFGNLSVKYFSSDLVTDFRYLYKAYNPLISLTSKSVKFISLISDEIRFKTPGWDKKILEYSNYFQDGIFRIKLSKYKYFNYTDEWECGFAPDSLAFYSRDWIFLQGMWNPCTGPDSFQALVSFYMMKAGAYSDKQYCRDIVDPFLLFSGEGASVGLEGDAKRKRIADNNSDWFKLFSYKNLSIAKRNASILISFIEYRRLISKNKFLKLNIIDDGRFIYIKDGINIKFKVCYDISRVITILKIITRAPLIHYYAGGGKSVIKKNPLNGLRMMAMTYAPRLEGLLGDKIQ